MTELLKKCLSFFIIFLTFSCSVSEPVIRENKWDINIIKDLKKDITYETLSLFVNCYDDDGEEDIEVLFIIDDESGIYWELDKDNWMETTVMDDRWIGSNSIIMPDYSPIPRNSLRINIRDMAGEVAEDKIFITKGKIDYSKLKFPELIIKDGFYNLKEYEKGDVFIYSKQDSLLAKGVIDNTPRSFTDIFKVNRSDFKESIYIYVSVKDGDLNLESGPWN